MRTFAEFYNILNENVNAVPSKVLGMSNSTLDLPDYKPYGFWVDRHGNFIEVPRLDHLNIIKGITKAANKYYKENGIQYYTDPTYGEFLNNLGWCRVVMGHQAVLYEIGDGQTLSNSQLKFLKILQEHYELPNIEKD